MSETPPHGDSTSHNQPPASPILPSDDTSGQASSLLNLAAKFARKPKASTFSVLPIDLPRRPAVVDGTFATSAPPYRHISTGSLTGATQSTQGTTVECIRKSSQLSSISSDKKENIRVSPELKKQLETLIKSPSSSISASSSRSKPCKGSASPAWSITASSIAVRSSEPVQSITTRPWEPPEEIAPLSKPLPFPETQSEYFSFPPFKPYPKDARPGLHTRRSDKSWLLLQRLKGKISEIHNTGQIERSGRSSSRTSVSSRISSKSPTKRAKSRSDTKQSARRQKSGGEASSHRSLLRPSNANVPIQPVTVGSRRMVSFTPNTSTSASSSKVSEGHNRNPSADPQINSALQATNKHIQPSTDNHITITEQASPCVEIAAKQSSPGRKQGSSTIVGITQSLASSIFHSLVTIATGDISEEHSAPAQAPDRNSHLVGDSTEPDPNKKETIEGDYQDDEFDTESSGDELTFMEYVKRFADSSSPPAKQPSQSTPSIDEHCSPQAAQPELPNESNEMASQIANLQEAAAEEAEGRTPAPGPSTSALQQPNPPKAGASNPRGKAPESDRVPYRAEDYDIITTYFYNTQARLLKTKWPFLLDNEIKHLVDTKWLEMEWEDLEQWAEESAKHIEEEGYIEPDLFEELTLIDPRKFWGKDKEGVYRRMIMG
ncbi:hypothetical protein DRE_05194 [Drechslerella stenobrocha 248]|uniref:Uncharacterized protein n=1 Tax=Drechslerella stenobrocha 248 TaxID=1043628 RepID=W7I0B0_9PEZI|nr:hypothetical protein DRE_05194 [Drechslerella stenobrocha 248]